MNANRTTSQQQQQQPSNAAAHVAVSTFGDSAAVPTPCGAPPATAAVTVTASTGQRALPSTSKAATKGHVRRNSVLNPYPLQYGRQQFPHPAQSVGTVHASAAPPPATVAAASASGQPPAGSGFQLSAAVQLGQQQLQQQHHQQGLADSQRIIDNQMLRRQSLDRAGERWCWSHSCYDAAGRYC